MAQQKSGDQTEKPTPKRLRDARREGQVAKSRELTSTVLVLGWLAVMWLVGPYLIDRIAALFEATFRSFDDPAAALRTLSLSAGESLFVLTLLLLLPAALLGLLVEFLQAGPMFVLKRVQPRMSHLDPVQGFKRMFSQENLVEVVKSLVKTTALVAIFVLVMLRMLDAILGLPQGPATAIAAAHWRGLMWIGVWVVFVFFFVSALDAVYQRHVFIKNLKMSRRDIRDEHKTTEGDPQIKSRRRQLHQEWAQQNMLAAVRTASVVVTNPTHIAVALYYAPSETDLPTVTAKGEDYEAQLIREAAESAGVPVMQNVELARGLHEKLAIDEFISPEFFDAVAELLHWAQTIRAQR